MKQLHGLYAITSANLLIQENFIEIVEQTLSGGARIIQYRDKTSDTNKRFEQALQLKKLCDQHQALLIINDDIELAFEVNADGVHIGSNDESIDQARQKLGPEKIIGVSCYNKLELAQQAKIEGANYIAFGSFFPSPTKPEAATADLSLIHQAKTLNIPICTIGGITHANAPQLVAAGADMLAVISDIFDAADIRAASQRISQLLDNKTNL
ncbi:MAG: thiamine phosphate synthase [Gammaproteobacteria bacterium]|nr:thiamine phosphate synthase [Gammaproteobacteria bacterium]